MAAILCLFSRLIWKKEERNENKNIHSCIIFPCEREIMWKIITFFAVVVVALLNPNLNY